MNIEFGRFLLKITPLVQKKHPTDQGAFGSWGRLRLQIGDMSQCSPRKYATEVRSLGCQV